MITSLSCLQQRQEISEDVWHFRVTQRSCNQNFHHQTQNTEDSRIFLSYNIQMLWHRIFRNVSRFTVKKGPRHIVDDSFVWTLLSLRPAPSEPHVSVTEPESSWKALACTPTLRKTQESRVISCNSISMLWQIMWVVVSTEALQENHLPSAQSLYSPEPARISPRCSDSHQKRC